MITLEGSFFLKIKSGSLALLILFQILKQDSCNAKRKHDTLPVNLPVSEIIQIARKDKAGTWSFGSKCAVISVFMAVGLGLAAKSLLTEKGNLADTTTESKTEANHEIVIVEKPGIWSVENGYDPHGLSGGLIPIEFGGGFFGNDWYNGRYTGYCLKITIFSSRLKIGDQENEYTCWNGLAGAVFEELQKRGKSKGFRIPEILSMRKYTGNAEVIYSDLETQNKEKKHVHETNFREFLYKNVKTLINNGKVTNIKSDEATQLALDVVRGWNPIINFRNVPYEYGIVDGYWQRN
ncbi:MAG: hypothetical protein LBK29_03095 [Oscillospiraceae bacterium]|jgi:hypothetical protein|nr:hypothetical protein [Oscillospiraceae bacterium]